MLINDSRWKWGTVAGVSLFATFSLAYFFLGHLNADEGWYLIAAREVYKGRLPYQDFPFTQAPLLPYLYGLGQMVTGGVSTQVVLHRFCAARWHFI
jgi:hypothetical protein